MEAAIRWSNNTHLDVNRFLIADVSGNSLQYCEVGDFNDQEVKYKPIFQRDRLPNFTAFDWARHDEGLVAIGTAAGESKIIRINSPNTQSDFVNSFPIKLQRKCNSIAFSRKNLLASGLDRARNDSSLNLYDLRSQPSGSNTEPYRRLSTSEVVTNVKFFSDQPDILLAGISRQCIRLYDLRESTTVSATQSPTRQVHFISIDPLDENYFASASPSGENVVSVWDRRALARSTASAIPESTSNAAVLDIRPAIDASQGASIWSLRYSGYRRGCFGVMSSTGQIRLFDVTKYPEDVDAEPASPQISGGISPEALHFVRKSQNLQYPWHDANFGQNENARAIAFDFAPAGSLKIEPCLLTIRQDRNAEQSRNLKIVQIPQNPALVQITSTNEMSVNFSNLHCVAPPNKHGNIADDLMVVQTRAYAKDIARETNGSTTYTSGATTALKDLFNQRSRIDGEMSKWSSRERHEALLKTTTIHTTTSIADTLTSLETQRRRCKEGYLFDCEVNKEIVKNDPWLVDLWDVIKRMESISKDDGMIHEALDLSFLGVHHIWNAILGPSPARISRRPSASVPDFSTAINVILFKQGYEDFQGTETEFPEHRQLGLVLCGWKFEESKLRAKCSEIISRREYYKAIVVAVCHGRKDIAIDLLKSLTKTKVIENTSIGAVIACETVSPEQRAMCEWMADEAEDPYLKALLAYFVSADWYSVVEMTELPLLYRVAIALKYVDDKRLGDFLKNATEEAVAQGDTEGILLTGLTERSMDLFQNYIAKSNDVQTAVLATALVFPRYINDWRWEAWKEAYFMDMQAWKAFMERTRFIVQHSRKAIGRDGKRLIKPAPRQVTLRCNNCQKSIAHNDDVSEALEGSASATASAITRVKSPSSAMGTVCPQCNRHLPRCSICLLWLGTPEPTKPTVAAALAEEELMARFINFCMFCNHGFHAHHARDWFTKHQICPVPDCHCVCALRS